MKPDDFVPFSKKNRRDVIFEKLEELIENGYWKPGDQILTESELSQRFNVGRSTVREALKKLRSQGLIFSQAGKGTFVKHPPTLEPELYKSVLPEELTREELLNIMDFRFCVEPVIAALATQHITKEERAELLRLTQDMKNNPLQSSESYAETDLKFHTLIAEASRNELFLTAMRAVTPHMIKQHILTSSVPEMRPMGPRYHYQLIEAFEKGMPRMAEAIMRAHIDETYHYIKQIAGLI